MEEFNFNIDKGDLPEWYVKQKIKKEYPHIELLGEYKNMSTYLECHCTKHDVYFKTSPQNILQGHECVECGLEKLSKKSTLSQKEFEDMIKLVNLDIEVISEYKGMSYDITVRCKKCGYTYTLNAQILKTNGTRCKKCSYTYKGEDEIIKILENLNCEYIHQHKFENCKDIRPLPFDFYLQKYNLCIEYDGQQHFEPRFGLENFIQTQKHDKIKNKYYEDNNIDLLRIPYWEFNNMKDIITKELKIS